MKKTLVWIGIILGVFLCWLGSFYLGRAFAEKKLKSSGKENAKIVFSEEKLKEIVDVIPHKANLTNLEKDLTNTEKLNLAFRLIYIKNNEQYTKYKGADLKTILIENFGSDLKVKLESVKCGCGDNSYIYDSKTDIYKLNENHGHGALDFVYADNYISSYEIIKNVVNVKVTKVFYTGDGVGPILGYYLSYEDALKYGEEGKNLKIMPNGNNEDYNKMGLDYFEEVRKKEKYKIPIYTYTFEKIGDNFIFKGYELSK